MTIYRRAAQVIADLKTLGIVEDGEVSCKYLRKSGGLSISILISERDLDKYDLVSQAFKLEFSSDISIDRSEFYIFIYFN